MERSLYIQDTVNTRLVIRINTDKLISDSVFRKMDEIPGYLKHADTGSSNIQGYVPRKVVINDTLSVCRRNAVADVTFSDSLNFINDLRFIPSGRVLYGKKSETTNAGYQGREIILIENLKEGASLPLQPFRNDFITLAVFFAAFVIVSVRSALKNTLPEITRFFLFRGIGESSSRDVSSLFSWPSTIINFIAFLIYSMFAFSAATFYGVRPQEISPVLFLLILFGIVVFGITSRHFICRAAGNLSGQTDLFNEYLVTVYQSYRFGSILLYIFLILMTYTLFIPQKIWVLSGFASLVVFYCFRVSRLFSIFLKRGVSILFLILYLCALEFLPVLVLIKYFTGLV